MHVLLRTQQNRNTQRSHCTAPQPRVFTHSLATRCRPQPREPGGLRTDSQQPQQLDAACIHRRPAAARACRQQVGPLVRGPPLPAQPENVPARYGGQPEGVEGRGGGASAAEPPACPVLRRPLCCVELPSCAQHACMRVAHAHVHRFLAPCRMPRNVLNCRLHRCLLACMHAPVPPVPHAVMWKYLEQASFPLTEDEYMQQLDAVAEYLTEWGVVDV